MHRALAPMRSLLHNHSQVSRIITSWEQGPDIKNIMYKDLTQEAATLTKWLIGIPSVTGTAGEAVAVKAIYDGLMEFPYFKRHPEHLHYIPHEDQKNSSLMALVKAHDPCAQTIVLISNVDTAGAESFGALKPLACQVGQLKEKLKSLNIISKKDKDTEGNLYGLGSYECKGALGSLIALVKEFSDNTLNLDFNIVFLCLSCSYQDLQGMRACSGYLSKLLSSHELKPVISLCFKPNFPEHQDDDDLHLYTGNLGVCEPSFFILGKGAAAGRPFSGFSPTLIASSIIKKMELNSNLLQKLSNRPLVPSFAHIFSRSARNHQSPDAVQISFNLTFSSLDLSELIEYLKEIACDAVMECSDLIDDRQIYYQYLNSHDHIPEVKDAEILSYTDLFERAKHHYKGNLAAAVQALADKCRSEGLSERECCFCIIERLNELSHLAKPSVVVFMGPSFIPAQGLRSRDQHDRELIICLKNTLGRMEQTSPRIPTLSGEYPSCDGNLMRPLGLDDASRLLAQECPCGTKTCINFNCPNITLGIIGSDLYETTEHVKEESFAYIAAFVQDLMQELAVLTGRRRRHVIGSEHNVPESRLDNEIKESEPELPSAEKLAEEQRLEEELQATQSVITQNLREKWQDTTAAKKGTDETAAQLITGVARPKPKETKKTKAPAPKEENSAAPAQTASAPPAPQKQAAKTAKPQEQGRMQTAPVSQEAPQRPDKKPVPKPGTLKDAAASKPAQDEPKTAVPAPDAAVQQAQAQSPAAADQKISPAADADAKEDKTAVEALPQEQSVQVPEPQPQESAPKKKGLFSKAVSKLKGSKARPAKDPSEEDPASRQTASDLSEDQAAAQAPVKEEAQPGTKPAETALNKDEKKAADSATAAESSATAKTADAAPELKENSQVEELQPAPAAEKAAADPADKERKQKTKPQSAPQESANQEQASPVALQESAGTPPPAENAQADLGDKNKEEAQTQSESAAPSKDLSAADPAAAVLQFAPGSDLTPGRNEAAADILLNVVPAGDLETTVEQDLKESRQAAMLLEQRSAAAAQTVVTQLQDTIITDSRAPRTSEAFDLEKIPATLIASSNGPLSAPEQKEEEKPGAEEAEDALADQAGNKKTADDPGSAEKNTKNKAPKEDEAANKEKAKQDPAALDLKDKEQGEKASGDKAGTASNEERRKENSDLIFDLKNMLDAPPEHPVSEALYSQAQDRQNLISGLNEFEKSFVPQISLEFMPALDEQEQERKQSLKLSDPDAYRAIYGEAVGEGPHIIAKDRSSLGWFAKFRRTAQDPDDLPVVIAQEEEHSKRLHKKGGPPRDQAAKSP